MKIIKSLTLLTLLIGFVACQNEETLIVEDPGSEALQLDIDYAQYQNTPLGSYKGVFSTADSEERGTVVIQNLNSTNSSATITYTNGITEEFSATPQEGNTILFSSGNTSFKFTVNEDGSNPLISEAVKDNKPSFITIVKENTRDAVSMFTGTFETDASVGAATGTWSIVFDNGNEDGATTEVTTQTIFNGADIAATMQTNEQLACAIKGRKGECPISGSYASTLGFDISWSGQHTYRDEFDCSSARGTWTAANGLFGTFAPDTDCHGTGDIIITEIHNRPQKPTQQQLDDAFTADPTNPMNDTSPDEDHVEWFEIYNTTDAPIDMTGWLISDGSGGGDEPGDSGTTTMGAFTIGAGEYAVFSGFNIPDAQGGVVFDYRYDYQRPSFNNESSYADVGDTSCPDGVLLYNANGDLVDEVLYDYGFSNYIAASSSNRCNLSTVARGIPASGSSSRTSFQLVNDPAVMNAYENDNGANWSFSTNVYDDNTGLPEGNQLGTPGTANDM